MDVKAPVVALMVYMETSLELKFTTYANLLAGSTAMETGSVPVAIVPTDVRAPVVVLMVYIETSVEPGFAT